MIYYIYREQWYKTLLSLNEEDIFEIVLLMLVKMKSGKYEISPCLYVMSSFYFKINVAMTHVKSLLK